jgi:hypothetical protein
MNESKVASSTPKFEVKLRAFGWIPYGFEFDAVIRSCRRIADIVNKLSAAILSDPAGRTLYLLIAPVIVKNRGFQMQPVFKQSRLHA